MHQGIVNGSIADFFAILLQYNSKHRIVLFTVVQKKKYIYIYIYFTPPISSKFLSHPSHFFCSLLSLPSLFLHLLSPLWSFIAEISHPSPKFFTHLTRPLSHLSSHSLSLIALVLGFGFLRLEVGLAWIGKLGLDHWVGIGWWWVWISWSVGLKWWICWSVGGSFGLIIDSSDGGSGDDFWVFSTAWVSNQWRGFVNQWLGFADQWLGWWVGWLLLAPTGLMVCVCVALLMVCVCVCVCVALCVWWWVWIGWSVYHGFVCVWLFVLNRC